MPQTNPCQVDIKYRGHTVKIMAAETSIGWSWAALVDSRYTLESDEGGLDTASLALAFGKTQVKRIIDADTDTVY